MNKAKIIVVEDDPAIRNLIRMTLNAEDYQFHTVSNGVEAMRDIVSYQPDVIILDLGLPDIDGMEIIKKVRGWSQVPIIVVSARGEDQDKVEALDAGADDYLTKPFSVDEFLARLRAALRRSISQTNLEDTSESVYENGDIRIDYAAGCAYLGEEELHLTPIEYELLCVLAKNTGKVLTHNYILKEVWGNTFESEIPSLRVFVATLRKKLQKNADSPKYIQTHVGVGYRMIRQ